MEEMYCYYIWKYMWPFLIANILHTCHTYHTDVSPKKALLNHSIQTEDPQLTQKVKYIIFIHTTKY